LANCINLIIIFYTTTLQHASHIKKDFCLIPLVKEKSIGGDEVVFSSRRKDSRYIMEYVFRMYNYSVFPGKLNKNVTK